MQSLDDQSYNIGYGLIGAYLLVFIGIAVSLNLTLALDQLPMYLLFRYPPVNISI